MVEERTYKLDGESTGFAIKDDNNKLIALEGVKKFQNLELLNAFIERADLKIPYEKGIYFENGFWAPVRELVERDEWYDHFGANPDPHVIMNIFCPVREEKILKMGYVVFGDSPRVWIENPDEGKTESIKNYKIIAESCARLLRNDTFKNQDTDERGFTYYTLFGNTLKFRFIKNYRLVKMNEGRILTGEPAIPFDKTVDKYKTIYFIVTKDIADPFSEDNLNSLASEIMYELLAGMRVISGESVNLEFSTARGFFKL